MTATYTLSISSLDGYGAASGDWTGYWASKAPELLEHRLAVYSTEQRMVYESQRMSGVHADADGRDRRER